MKFYIVTPTYNSLLWVQRCMLSVADQVDAGVEVHHHVQDGGSSDGTAEYLKRWQAEHEGVAGYTFTWESTKDAGMYDAINMAWEKMPEDADVTAHLNSDEQYLPHALKGVAEGFRVHKGAHILLSSYIVLDINSRYICHRRPMMPYNWISQTVCEIVTCAAFHSVPEFRKHGKRFDTQWKIIGDLVHYRDILSTHPRIAVVPNLFTSSFTVTGNNLGWSEAVEEESRRSQATVPCYARKLKKLAGFVANVKRRSCDLWYAAPREYSVYMPDSRVRESRAIKRPTSHWGCREVGEE